LFGSTAKGTALGAGAGGEEIEDGSIGRERGVRFEIREIKMNNN
jgi:hypothetical protein